MPGPTILYQPVSEVSLYNLHQYAICESNALLPSAQSPLISANTNSPCLALQRRFIDSLSLSAVIPALSESIGVGPLYKCVGFGALLIPLN